MQVGEEHMPVGDLAALLALRLLHLDDQLGLFPRVADARARLLVRCVGRADARTGIGLHHDLVVKGDQLAHRSGREPDPVLVRLDFLRYADDHRSLAFASASTTEVCSPSSIFAIWLRCTSSGPSAKRNVLACAYAYARPKSSETPPPPCTCIAQSITWSATFGASTLIIAISFFAALLPTVSIFQAAFKTRKRALSIMMRASAMRSRVTPWSATGRPKATRWVARLHIFSSARSAWPMSRMQ